MPEAVQLVEEFGLAAREVLHFHVGPERATVPRAWHVVPTRNHADEPALLHWVDAGQALDGGLRAGAGAMARAAQADAPAPRRDMMLETSRGARDERGGAGPPTCSEAPSGDTGNATCRCCRWSFPCTTRCSSCRRCVESLLAARREGAGRSRRRRLDRRLARRRRALRRDPPQRDAGRPAARRGGCGPKPRRSARPRAPTWPSATRTTPSPGGGTPGWSKPSRRVVRTWPSGRPPSRTGGGSASPSGDVAPTPAVASAPTSRRFRRSSATWSSGRGCSGGPSGTSSGCVSSRTTNAATFVWWCVRCWPAAASTWSRPWSTGGSRGADNRSLHQRDLYDQARVADRVRAIRMRRGACSPTPRTRCGRPTSPRCCTRRCRTWSRRPSAATTATGTPCTWELASLLDIIPSATLDRVPVADRITAWLCAQDERAATEEYLEYAFDNRNGFPFGLSDGRPRITLPFIDALSTAPRGLTLVADADMRFRARLTRARWVSEKVLLLEGAAFMEYLDDRCGESVIELVLTEQRVRPRGQGADRTVRGGRW